VNYIILFGYSEIPEKDNSFVFWTLRCAWKQHTAHHSDT